MTMNNFTIKENHNQYTFYCFFPFLFIAATLQELHDTFEQKY